MNLGAETENVEFKKTTGELREGGVMLRMDSSLSGPAVGSITATLP